MTKANRAGRFLEMFCIGTKNFMGSGLSVEDFMRLGAAEKFAASWANQDQAERKRRLSAVMRLSVELARISEITMFSTRLCEMAIESVIEGDWKAVSEWADHFSFESEGEQLRISHAPIFAAFRELLRQVVRAGEGVAS